METKIEEKVFTLDWRVLTDAEIVTDDLQSELIQWREVFRAGQFRVGDIALQIIEDASFRGIVIPDSRVDGAVSRFCGKSPRTVRYYRETAAFYPQEVRQEFDILPFSHFVFARTMGIRWREVLEFSASQPGMTENSLRYSFLGGIALLTGEVGRSESADDQETPCETPGDEPKIKTCEVSQALPDRAMKHVRMSALNAVASSIDAFCKAVEESDVSEDTKDALIGAANIIRKYVPEVLKSMV